MNKTININIGGLSFNIDENAFAKLERYLKAIEKSLEPDGRVEIMNDIEMRISEIFSEKILTPNHVIDLSVVDYMIGIMGQPQDYKLEDTEGAFTYQTIYRGKKLYRDVENNLLGGVCAGLGHYLGIDVIWVRLLVILFLFLVFGTPILVYIILWIIMPPANTTSKRIEMKGEPVNLSNITQKVKENLENVGDEASKIGSKTTEYVSNFGHAFFSVVAKLIGVFITVIASLVLVALIMALFSSVLGYGVINNYSMIEFVDLFLVDDIPFWLVALIGFLALGIPIFFLLILGLKLMIDQMNSLSNPFKYSLLGLWVISLIGLMFFAVKQTNAFSYSGVKTNKIDLPFSVNDTIKVSFDSLDKNVEDDIWVNDFVISQDKNGQAIMKIRDISFEVLISDEPEAFFQVIKKSKGNSFEDAKIRAEAIDYQYLIEANHLKFNEDFFTDTAKKYRNQAVRIKLYLPKDQLLILNESVDQFENFDFGVVEYPNVIKENRLYKVSESTIKCLNCNQETEDAKNEDSNDTINKISVNINGQEVLVAEPKKGRLVIDKNGVVTKK